MASASGSATMDDSSNNKCEDSPAPPKWKFWLKPEKPVHVEEPKYPPVPYPKLFRYASTSDKGMILLSLLAAMGHGVLLPTLTVLFGRVVDEFASVLCNPDDDPSCAPPSGDVRDVIGDTVNWFLYVAVIAFVLSFLQLGLSLIAANRMGNGLRQRFFDSLARQDCDFYDDSAAGTLTNIVINDIQLIQGGVGDKLATAVQYITTFVTGIIIGFVYGWKLTLVILGVTPVLLLSGMVFGNASADATGDGLGAYGEAGGIANEVLGLIRTVTSFGGQEEEARRYEKSLDKAYKSGVKAALTSGLGLGTAMCCILCTYGLAFWVGGILARNDEMTAGDVLLTFFAITLGASSLGTAGPAFKSFSVARAAAPRVFEIIDRQSPIDPLSSHGIIPTEPASGRLSFENVDFNYAKRIVEDGESNLVLDDFNLDIPVGTSEAFVGKSGSGKSTIAKLIQRFYDPISGSIKLDGVDIRELNTHWLRSQIGVVAQMPSLFMLSIRENIALGAGMEFTFDDKSGQATTARRQVSEEEVIAAAKMANAHDFISKLPEGYETMLGERGAMLSGGQKQRVCIARALVRDPKILLLDESTSALDSRSEQIVQDALDKASAGRTTVTIAHRLSTIRNADKISCIQSGKIIERGSHKELVAIDEGFYRGLHDLQNTQKEKLDDENGLDAEADSDLQLMKKANDLPSVSHTGVDSTTAHLPSVASEEEQRPATDKGVFWRTMKLNSGESVYIVLGIIGAVAAGMVWPLAAIPLAEMIEILAIENGDAAQVRKWALVFVGLAFLAFFGNTGQHGVLGVSGEKLTRKLRSMAFRSLLKQEIGYYDMEDNSVGALTGRLSTDAGAVKGLTGDLFGVGVNIIGSLVTGMVIAFINCWQLTLVILAIIPGIALGGAFEMQASAGIDSGARKDFASANTLAAEAVDNIATVRTLGVEAYFTGRYSDMIHRTRRAKLRKAVFIGIAFGFSEFCQFLIWYATFKAGGDFVEKEYCTFKEMILASMAILFSAITLGNVSVFAPDVGASKLGATHVYRLVDRQSQIDPFADEGEDVDNVEGHVGAEKVYFEYPRRPDVPVLRGLTLDVAKGSTLAIVGTSGHGKSTIISLLQRFYNIRQGEITVDNRNVESLKVQGLRSHIGLVSQEPELFNRSVFDNIAYGAPHADGTPISMDEVVEAAKLANAHEFITQLPQGYDTSVGPRGDAISGGQRQRVAIARSLIRKPPVLLLDEATSALDNASEKLVQEALERASAGRTTIVVAHRLSTIRNADQIAVVRKGRVVELGTHEELLRKNGQYADLMRQQLSDV